MISSKEEHLVLVDFGLTLLQAKVFLSLVEHGSLNAGRISFFSGVSRPDVYRALKNLHKLGFVNKEITEPFKFSAISLAAALDILMQKRKNKSKELKNKSKSLLDKVMIHERNEIKEESKFRLYPPKEALMKKLANSIKKTSLEINIITTKRRLEAACFYFNKPLLEAWKRKVKGRAIINQREQLNIVVTNIWKYPSAIIRYTSDDPITTLAIYDKKEVYIFTQPEAEIKDSSALWSNNPNLVNIASRYFESIWTNTQSINSLNSINDD